MAEVTDDFGAVPVAPMTTGGSAPSAPADEFGAVPVGAASAPSSADLAAAAWSKQHAAPPVQMPDADTAITTAQAQAQADLDASNEAEDPEPKEAGLKHLLWTIRRPFVTGGQTAAGSRPIPTGVAALEQAMPAAGVGDFVGPAPMAANAAATKAASAVAAKGAAVTGDAASSLPTVGPFQKYISPVVKYGGAAIEAAQGNFWKAGEAAVGGHYLQKPIDAATGWIDRKLGLAADAPPPMTTKQLAQAAYDARSAALQGRPQPDLSGTGVQGVPAPEGGPMEDPTEGVVQAPTDPKVSLPPAAPAPAPGQSQPPTEGVIQTPGKEPGLPPMGQEAPPGAEAPNDAELMEAMEEAERKRTPVEPAADTTPVPPSPKVAAKAEANTDIPAPTAADPVTPGYTPSSSYLAGAFPGSHEAQVAVAQKALEAGVPGVTPAHVIAINQGRAPILDGSLQNIQAWRQAGMPKDGSSFNALAAADGSAYSVAARKAMQMNSYQARVATEIAKAPNYNVSNAITQVSQLTSTSAKMAKAATLSASSPSVAAYFKANSDWIFKGGK